MRAEKRKNKEEKKAKRKQALDDDSDAPKKPKGKRRGERVTVAVVECTRQKSKKGNSVTLCVNVVIQNHSKSTLKVCLNYNRSFDTFVFTIFCTPLSQNVSLKIKDKNIKIDAGDDFKLTGKNVLNKATDGSALKVAKGETLTLEFFVEAADPAEVKGTLSYSTKEEEKEKKLILVHGAADCLGKVSSKVTKETFFEAMSEMNQNKDTTTSIKKTITVPGTLEGALETLKTRKLRAVEVLDSCAALMGSLVLPSGKYHVCLLVKSSSSSAHELSLELKTPAPEEPALTLLDRLLELLQETDEDEEEEDDDASPTPAHHGFLNLQDMDDEDDVPVKKGKKEKKDKKEKKSKKEVVVEEEEEEPTKKDKKDKKEKKSKKDKKEKEEPVKPEKQEKKSKKEKKEKEEKPEKSEKKSKKKESSLAFLDM